MNATVIHGGPMGQKMVNFPGDINFKVKLTARGLQKGQKVPNEKKTNKSGCVVEQKTKQPVRNQVDQKA